MTNILYATEQAVLSALSTDAGVQAVLGNPARVYDTNPAGAAFPYAVLGESHVTTNDSKSDAGFDIVIGLDVFSRSKGGEESRGVVMALYTALHRSHLTISGATFISCELHDADFRLQIDDYSYQATVRFVVRVGVP